LSAAVGNDAELEADVVVCGAGMAGMAAALAALESGARVALLEKGDRPGGSFYHAGGFLWTWRSLDEARRRIPHANPELLQLVIEGLDDSTAWLRSFGVRTWASDIPRGHGRGQMLDPRPTIDHIIKLLVDGGVRFISRTGVESASPSAEGRFRLVCRDNETAAAINIVTNAVVLATGGFQGNPGLVRSYIGISLENVRLRGNHWSTGDGLQIALSMGGTTTLGLEHFYGHALADGLLGQGGITELTQMSQNYGSHGVAVNLAGLRFVDESAGTGEDYLNEALARQPGSQGFYIIDSNIGRTVRMPDGAPASSGTERAEACGAIVLRDDTLPGLMDLLGENGVPRDALHATLDEYNSHVLSGKPSAIWPPRAGNRTPLVEPPFTAVKVRAGITFTMGGIAVDTSMRVVRNSGCPSPLHTPNWPSDELAFTTAQPATIEGLFAAGADVGNISNSGYVGGLATAMITGRLAGANASRRLRLGA
jgi:succinate dehydrogenase/fumarate reductase flavoprotein subunit